jgi:hypothetical protein
MFLSVKNQPLGLRQEPMKEQRVEADQDQRKNDDDVIHSLFFLSAVSLYPMRVIGFSGFAIRWAKLVTVGH